MGLGRIGWLRLSKGAGIVWLLWLFGRNCDRGAAGDGLKMGYENDRFLLPRKTIPVFRRRIAGMKLFQNVGWLAVLVGFVSCAGLKQPKPEIQYYTLEYTSPQISASEPVSALIRFEPFEATAPYHSDRMIYREGAFKRDAYFYYRWRVAPAQLVSYLLKRDVRASGLFEAVLPGPCDLAPTFRLRGTVDDFLEWDEADRWEAVLTLSVTFIAEDDSCGREKILLQNTYRSRERCEQKTPQAVARAMSLAMSEVSGMILRDLYHSLKRPGS